MSSFVQDVKYKFANLNVLEKIIAINVVVFVLTLVFKDQILWLELPSSFSEFITKPWTIISYAFLHFDWMHILFNMLWLYFLGRMFLNLFSPKMALNIYLLGVILGGFLFMLGYSLMPALFGGYSRLVGASAGVRALLVFLCAYMPNQEVRFFTFNIKLWYIGLGIVLLDLFGLFGANAGGNLAHLGGAILGYFYAKQLQNGTDIGKGFELFMDKIFNLFKPSKKGL